MCDDLEDVEAVENDDYTFAIQCDGDPKPVCKWTKDGEPIDVSDGHFEISENSGIYHLKIKGLKMEDKGRYGAEFTNKAGEKKVEANLNVLGESPMPVVTNRGCGWQHGTWLPRLPFSSSFLLGLAQSSRQ